MRTYILFALFLVAVAALVGASRFWNATVVPQPTFAEECLADGNMWHSMQPLRNGVQLAGDQAAGCMTANGLHHFADAAEYRAAKDPGESDASMDIERIGEGMVYNLRFNITAGNGVPELYREHERYLHVIIVSHDMRHFAHVHPEEQPGFDAGAIARGTFDLVHEFPAPGEYLVAIDYANRLKHESRTFRMTVPGEHAIGTATFASPQTARGYTVAIEHGLPLAGNTTTVRFTVEKDGKPVTDMRPYLGAAMHVAVVKDDLSEFVHTHGETHRAGIPTAYPHSHVHAPPPARFGPEIEAHVTFPSAGRYTIFAEFAGSDGVVRVPFSVRVE